MPRLHPFLLACFAFALMGLAPLPSAWGAQVKVRGAARISVHIARGRMLDDQGARRAPDAVRSREMLIEGSLEDDVGARLSSERVEVRIVRSSDGAEVRFDDALRAVTCTADARPIDRVSGGEALSVASDEAGRFCARVSLPVERYNVGLSTASSGLLDGGTVSVPADLGRRSVSLSFDGLIRRVALDRPNLALLGVAAFDDDDTHAAAEALPLRLMMGDTVLGSAVTGTSGQATFDVRTADLGEPGSGLLKLVFVGDANAAPAAATFAIEKHARVELTLAKAIEATRSPEDGVPIDVVLSTHAAKRSPSGIVEARVGDALVGAGHVEGGHARFSATFGLPDVTDVPIQLRFVPDAPWWDAPEALTVHVPISPLPAWRRLPLVIAGLLVLAFVALGRFGRVRSAPRPPKAKPAAGPAREGITLVETAGNRLAGWSGRIIDAHDRSPVRGARVVIEDADFRGTSVLASVFANDDGEFSLPPARSVELGRAHLVIDAPLHASLKKAVPPAGTLEIALISRKRALLDRLVDWARIRGRPYDSRLEPTPAHVQAAAAPGSAPARWAQAVESAAFGPDAVDGRIEAEVNALKPELSMAESELPIDQTRERVGQTRVRAK